MSALRPLVLLGSATLLLAGCADPSTTTGSSSASAGASSVASIAENTALSAKVPAAVKASGITVASDVSYPPMDFFATDNKTVIGAEADLDKALGTVLGVKVTITNVPFDSIIPGLQAGKYQLGISSFTDTAEREKVVDFVTYFNAGTSLLVPAGNPKALKAEGDSLCGRTVAVAKGSTQALVDLPARAKTCKTPIKVSTYPDGTGVNLAVTSGRADAALADSPVAAYAAKQSGGKLDVAGDSYGDAPFGIAVPKNSELTGLLKSALADLKASGGYRQILAKWGLESGALDTFEINAAS
ncbi:ABC transporter substrate-binding protein [Streptomyces sp. MBT65]|uniref:ABC transporter substrate-binding protein n=1 Tax=Streptomyces sp. MBT65 TaxID=1488395 RepID=UPI00190A1394|nr:ABC transporter substrate-binding protein [Streptomyces sp. MBT65]MBK3573052.1 ABC transporter substrate-binding protein [Streptomyces sp. MBT65]